jgi:recombination protein RecA
MPSASTIRFLVESSLAKKIPSALTPAPKMIRPVAATGIETLDEVLEGGLPIGAISELVGPECSGRTSVAFSFLASLTREAKVCAWVDVSNALDPCSATAAGVDLARLLWVRCGVSQKSVQQARRSFALPDKYLVPAPTKRGLHGGGFGPHPRGEARGLSQAVSGLFQHGALEPRCAEPQPRVREGKQVFESDYQPFPTSAARRSSPLKPWSRMEQALRTADLLLQAGGFSAIVLDMSSVAPEFVSRVPLATWFRYRAAAERTRSSILLLTQYACARSSAELLLRLQPGSPLCDETTVFSGIEYCVEVARRRFTEPPTKIIPLRKPPQSVSTANWMGRTAWAGRR